MLLWVWGRRGSRGWVAEMITGVMRGPVLLAEDATEEKSEERERGQGHFHQHAHQSRSHH
jgi:hypothetical protein